MPNEQNKVYTYTYIDCVNLFEFFHLQVCEHG